MHCATLKKIFVMPILVLTIVLYAHSSSSAILSLDNLTIPAPNDDSIGARIIVDNFLTLIDEGKVSLFGANLSRDMINPIKVSHEYLITEDSDTIVIYAQMREPVPVPDVENLIVNGISVSITAMGEVTEIKAHVSGH